MLINERGVQLLTRISAKLIYGTIILSAVLGSLTDPLPRNRRVIVILVLTLYGVNLANNYATSINDDLRNRRVTPVASQWLQLVRPNWLMAGVVVPVVFFGAAFLGLISQGTALLGTRYTLALLLFFMGFVARRVCGGNLVRSLLSGATVATLGYVVTQFKVWSKHLPGI